jgi:hypothetical protein
MPRTNRKSSPVRAHFRDQNLPCRHEQHPPSGRRSLTHKIGTRGFHYEPTQLVSLRRFRTRIAKRQARSIHCLVDRTGASRAALTTSLAGSNPSLSAASMALPARNAARRCDWFRSTSPASLVCESMTITITAAIGTGQHSGCCKYVTAANRPCESHRRQSFYRWPSGHRSGVPLFTAQCRPI